MKHALKIILISALCGALSLSSMATVSAIEKSNANNSGIPKGAVVRPGEKLGGNLIYDGFSSDPATIKKSGSYGMVYEISEAKNISDCASPFSNFNVFSIGSDPKSIFLREAGRLTPTGDVYTIEPGGGLEVSSSRTDTESWQHSASVELEVGGKILGVGTNVKTKYEFTYQKEVSVTKGVTVHAANLTTDKIQSYQYGILSDVYAVQRTGWNTQWYKKGALIFVGSDKDKLAKWYSAPAAGCYRSADFLTISMPRSQGAVKVSEYPAGDSTDMKTSCVNPVVSDNATLYGRLSNGPGIKYFLETDEKVSRGTCLKLTGVHISNGTTQYSQLAVIQPSKRGCPVEPTFLCTDTAKSAWVETSEVVREAPEPLQLGTWNGGDSFMLSPMDHPGKYLNVYRGINADRKPPSGITLTNTWRLVLHGSLWSMEMYYATIKGYACLDRDNGSAGGNRSYIDRCNNHVDQRYQIIFAGQNTFYVRASSDTAKCLSSKPVQQADLNFAPCSTSDRTLRWSFSKVPGRS
jgi:hypothetical protein